MCYETEASLLLTSCNKGHKNSIHLLLSEEVNINAGTKGGASPFK